MAPESTYLHGRCDTAPAASTVYEELHQSEQGSVSVVFVVVYPVVHGLLIKERPLKCWYKYG